MSIDLNWEALTSGSDGEAFAETIRAFIDDRFQTVTLPRFIRSVSVHEFDFGTIPPELELKDICDPLPDFYEGDDDDDEDGEDNAGWQPDEITEEERNLRQRRKNERVARTQVANATNNPPPYVDMRLAGLRSIQTPGELGSPFLGVSTPGIPGGTSNLNYFHSQLATGFSGTQTPLAAVAGAHFQHGWPDYGTMAASRDQSASQSSQSRPSTGEDQQEPVLRPKDSVSSFAAQSSTNRPRTQDGLLDEPEAEEPRHFREPRIEDVQTVFRVKYSGDVKLSLTAEILLDYPMPSFVGIPIKLNITGLSFDGIGVVAYIRKRAHFCFLSPEDAITSAGLGDMHEADSMAQGHKFGGLLQEIKVESEIGQRENGKQSLKNVGKVEKFVLEQVRRIFEDEFVYPSFWTFLV